MIELRGVTKVFGNNRAVDRLDLTVRAGELFAFLGPNGAGKTTTIKMICGLLAPTAGSVLVGGHPRVLEGSPAAARLRPRPALPVRQADRPRVPPVRGRDVRAGADPRRCARIDELIETFEMADFIDELCENYSQGMKQRVVFASALVHSPKVLVVDEPLVGLDPRSARIVKNLFVSQARSGAAVLMSIHLLAIAEELADTIGIVDRGRMLTVGTLAQLRERAQHDGSLEDLFLKLTGNDIPARDGADPSWIFRDSFMSLAISEPIRLPASEPPSGPPARLRWLRWWQVRNTIRTALQGSRLRISMILFCSAVFWGGLFILFLGGFQFIGLYVDLANTIIEYLFSMFFLSLLVMLFFSTGIIVYTTLFHSREAAYLLTTPASTDRIFAYKFAEAVGFSSWGFFLLGSPLHGGLRPDGQGPAGVLPDVPALPALVRADSRAAWERSWRSWWPTSFRGGRRPSWRLSIVGIARGWRSSWASASGGLPAKP